MTLEFEWDENKNRSNRLKHGVTFEQAIRAFYDPALVLVPDRIVDGEQRWQAFGLVRGVVLLLVVHTLRYEEGVEFVRVISARTANRSEETLYARENGSL